MRVQEFSDRAASQLYSEDLRMLWTIAVILFILWLLGFFVVHVGGGLIHLLLVIAVIVIVYRLITGRPVT
jgi:fatty acid desaturase